MSKKPSTPMFLYEFQTIQSAETFYEYAMSHCDAKNVQYPLDKSGLGNRILTKVLITGTGSFLYDSNLKRTLNQVAANLGGVLV